MNAQLDEDKMDPDQAIIIKYIQENLLGGKGAIKLLPEDDLLGSGLLDSMGVMRLVGFVEDTFQIKIPPEDIVIENFMDVKAITNYVKS
ncbi:MAG TPA: acyl carrier protein [Flavisolibacter sp.]|nr:acyl carrier protein [Flavisolibacter sp.]